VPSGTRNLYRISCFSAKTCYTTGFGSLAAAFLATTDGGKTWVNQSLPSGIGFLVGTSCSSAKTCFVAGVGTNLVGGLILTGSA
jgi:hypothetical protein